MPAVTPVVFYRDPTTALAWLEKAFGFELSMLVTDQEGRLGHAEMTWCGSTIGVGGEWADPQIIGPASLKSPASLGGVGTQFIRIFLEDGLDRHFERARAAGAHITQAPANQFYGDRTYRALDLEGHVWSFAQKVQDLSVAEMEKASGLTFKTGGAA